MTFYMCGDCGQRWTPGGCQCSPLVWEIPDYLRPLVEPEPAQNRPLARPPQQIDLDGRLHDIAPQTERLRLFEPAPAQLAGQTYIDTDNEEAKR